MHRYFFDIVDQNGRSSDTQGMELENLEAAIAEARRTLGGLVKDALSDGEYLPIEIHIRHGGEAPVVLTVSMTQQNTGSS
jgi:hypothetical protein